ncbi:hypothetical protein JK2ML_0958 [Mycobacterium leprae Kyoto-2]|uniref:Membrane protein n=3 Tax=Mycobacterium leprae TaxID=1769 RepID=Q9CCC6_MYCLE|nr:hypothetical protein DIJ64_05150 [Mycobacterium leprae]OAR20713.1 hypothetical protein A8144_09495 [Mycobacterium leprae 3125609]OAX70894.1 hypothetical protein A3216_09280 [Mycobacterium leprae 7935681]CAR71053.1 putative membrane protein [Mycobacterium leprae Br4923]BBC16884.1 hypothetical protein JK2ML_0958 [Mycobacterium leprae Kyoto-2]
MCTGRPTLSPVSCRAGLDNMFLSSYSSRLMRYHLAVSLAPPGLHRFSTAARLVTAHLLIVHGIVQPYWCFLPSMIITASLLLYRLYSRHDERLHQRVNTILARPDPCAVTVNSDLVVTGFGEKCSHLPCNVPPKGHRAAHFLK